MAKRIPLIKFLGPRHLLQKAGKKPSEIQSKAVNTTHIAGVKPFPFKLDPRLSLSIRDEVRLLDYLSVKTEAGKALDISSINHHKASNDLISMLAK